LRIDYYTFQKPAATVYAESSITYEIAEDKEIKAITSTHRWNRFVYRAGASLEKKFLATLFEKRTG
jgi:hypothetical protein